MLALAARSATKDLPDDVEQPAAADPADRVGLSADLVAVRRDPYAVT